MDEYFKFIPFSTWIFSPFKKKNLILPDVDFLSYDKIYLIRNAFFRYCYWYRRYYFISYYWWAIKLNTCHEKPSIRRDVILFCYVLKGSLYTCSAEQQGIKVDPTELTQFIDFVKRNKLQTESFIIGPNECKLYFVCVYLSCIRFICINFWGSGKFTLSIGGCQVVFYGNAETLKVVF